MAYLKRARLIPETGPGERSSSEAGLVEFFRAKIFEKMSVKSVVELASLLGSRSRSSEQ